MLYSRTSHGLESIASSLYLATNLARTLFLHLQINLPLITSPFCLLLIDQVGTARLPGELKPTDLSAKWGRECRNGREFLWAIESGGDREKGEEMENPAEEAV